MPKTTIDTLFLHMGPGLNSSIERKVLADDMPNVLFWDQPPVHSLENAFSVLVASAAVKIEEIYQMSNKPVHILAHSFGGHIVSHLLDIIPSKIGNCHLQSTCYDLVSGFFRLLKTMYEDEQISADLKKQIQIFFAHKKTHQAQSSEFWDYLQLIVQDSDFLRYYWPTIDAYEKYMEVARKASGCDMGTFKYVLGDFLNTLRSDIQPYKGKQKIFIELGGRDPLIDIHLEARLWGSRFPHAKICVLPESGHYIHLERKFS